MNNQEMAIEFRTVEKTALVSLGWFLGRGFVREKMKTKYDAWCVVEGGKVIAECRSKKIAERIAGALDHANIK